MPGKKADKTEVLTGQNMRPLILKKARFKVTMGRDEGKEMVLQKSLVTIGTLPGCDLVLTDPTVSRRHAEVEERSNGYMLRDHDSTNGTFIENADNYCDDTHVKAIIPSELEQLVRIGRTWMRIQPIE